MNNNQKILIISNNGLSDNEPNGRMISLLLNNYIDDSLYSYCLGGILDKENVNYIINNDKTNLKSLISFGYITPIIRKGIKEGIKSSNGSSNNKKKGPFLYLIRNFLYSLNFHIYKYLAKLIKKEDINTIFLFGTDAPYLYKLARKLSIKTSTKLVIYTCEDYPIKTYNYLSKKISNKGLSKLLHNILYKQAKKTYNIAQKCYFNSEDLLESYSKEFKLNNPLIKYLPSTLNKIEYKSKKISTIAYGGNLNSERVNSLIDISEAINKIDQNIKIEAYGKINDIDLNRINKTPNIIYKGLIKYEDLIERYKDIDMLIHMEGFSDYHILDCKHAFSTKISDCYKLNIPFFMYSPIEIASTKYGLKINNDFVATNKIELESKLKKIINKQVFYTIDYNKILEDFSPIKDF